MTKKNLKKGILLSLIFTILVCLIQIPTLAAGSFSASAGQTTMTVGDRTTFTANANSCGGQFTISSSNSGVVSIEGSTTEWIENGSHSVTLVAKSAGSATITLKAVSVADSETSEDITGSRTVTITVKEPAPVTPPSNNNQGGSTSPAKSGDATLKSITVAGKVQNNPGSDITFTVDANTNTAEIKAVPNHSGAKVSGVGTKELRTGSNTQTITVTAENGTTRNYIVRIRKLANETTTPNVSDNQTTNNNQNNAGEEPNAEEPENQEPEKLRLTYLMIDDAELMPAFDSEIFEYSLYVTNKTSLNIVAQANMEDANVEITGAEELLEGDNEIIIKLTKDEETVEYKIRVNKTTEEVIMPGTIDSSNGGNMGTGKTVGIGIGVVVVCLGLAGFCIWKLKSNGEGAMKKIRGMSDYTKSTFDNFKD